jgi:gamma-glutamyl-gamma-aminobutyrate hydrolase PuuD
MTKILVVNGPSYYKAVKILGSYSNDVEAFLSRPKDFDLVMFTGGEDISPEMYGDTSPRNLCYSNHSRDLYEKKIFDCAVNHGIRMTGICRGLQFLNVMAGGKMVHHLDHHESCFHDMRTFRGENITINSYHHQMVLPPEDAYVIGWSPGRRASEYFGNKDLEIKAPEKEIEAVLYPNIGAAGVQYHPEMMESTSDGYQWYEELVAGLLYAKMHELVARYSHPGETKCHVNMSAG